MKAPMSANSTTLGVICCIVLWSIPISAPARAMFSIPDSSTSKPAARLNRVEMWPLTSTTPSEGVMMPASTSSSVLLPAPLGPMTPSDSPRLSSKLVLRNAQKVLSPLSRLSMLAKLVRILVFLVKRRLYLTPRSSTRMASPCDGSDRGPTVTRD